MKIQLISLCLLFGFSSSPIAEETKNAEHRYIIDVVKSLKDIIHEQQNEETAQATLKHIKGSKALIKNNQYQGQQIIQSEKLNGFIGVKYNNKKASVAVYSTTPLKVRYATRYYQVFRNLLQEQYKEIRHNHFDLGDKVIARIKKQARKVTIDVYREKN